MVYGSFEVKEAIERGCRGALEKEGERERR